VTAMRLKVKSGKLIVNPLKAGRAFGTPCLVGYTGLPEPHFHTDKAVLFLLAPMSDSNRKDVMR